MIGDNKWRSMIFTLFCGFQVFACVSVLFCNLVLSSIVVDILFGICRFRLPSINFVDVGQDCMRLTVLCL